MAKRYVYFFPHEYYFAFLLLFLGFWKFQFIKTFTDHTPETL